MLYHSGVSCRTDRSESQSLKFILLQMPSNVVSQREYIQPSMSHSERRAMGASVVSEFQGQYPVDHDASGYLLRY
jgi:hypothetical protein